MKQVIVNVPEKKLDFFLELIKSLGLSGTAEPEVSEAAKKIVRERIRSAKASDYISWEKAKKKIRE